MSPLVLLHAFALLGVAALQPDVHPRGWQAARQAEQLRTQAAADAATATDAKLSDSLPPQQRSPLAVPASAPDARQPFCSAIDQPICPPLQLSHAPSWWQLAAATAASFAVGTVAGMLLLQYCQQQQNQRRKRLQLTADSQVEVQSQAASCAPAAGEKAQYVRATQVAGAAGLEPAGSETQCEGAAEQAEGRSQCSEVASARPAAAGVCGSSEAAVAQGGAGPDAVAVTGSPEESAVAAAVQRVVLQHSASISSTRSSSAPSAVPALTPALSSGSSTAPQQPQVQQEERQHQQQAQRQEGQQQTEPQPVQQKSEQQQEGEQAQQQETRQEQEQPQERLQGQGLPRQQHPQQAGSQLPLAAVMGGPDGSSALAVSSDGHAGLALRQEDQADIQAAAQLVLTMCQSMHVDPSQLDRGERLQLIYTMLHAWQAQQGRRHMQEVSRLGSEANVLRSQHRDIAERQAARQAAKDAYRLSLERTADFRRMCSDTLTFGLTVMVAAGTYQLLSRGLLSSITASCGSLSGALGGRRWGLWAAWRAAETVSCLALSIGDALLGLGVLLAAPWIVYRSGLLSDYHNMPVTKLFVGLGMICGLAGWLAVGKLGGSRGMWLATWEAWVVLHIAFSAAAHRMQRVRLQSESGWQDAGAMYDPDTAWLPATMWVLLGLVLPIAAGMLPFRM
ncbi:hypothetical protein D9Q98_008593 [Chlorella vulgaris]|uniref:Uncharacterized protein n=1 Tax=Chlorella vulgaris TaxID=3077 RepID=A0A9D4TIB9_CHLVU|nr:hypothetical protein D9Q98_008593 [Chlorella vulgaris]